jgi:hypothetical protein
MASKHMEPSKDPPTLEYSIPQEAPVTPTVTWVGLLGILVYGALSVLFFTGLMFLAYAVLARGIPARMFEIPGVIYVMLFSLSLWRTIAAFRGVLRNWRKS